MKFEQRLAIRTDVTFVRDCAEEAYELYVERIGRKPSPMVADFPTQIEAGFVEIIMADGQSAGFVVSMIRPESLFVENVAILPRHQGQGLVRQVFERLEQRAREKGLAALTLYTNEKMTENLTLYPYLGFKETGRGTESGFHRVYFTKRL